MANENELQIILSLVDKASGELKRVMGDTTKAAGDVNKETEKLGKNAKKSTDSLKDGFKQAGKEVRDFRQMIGVASIAMAVIVGTTKVWAERNKETNDAFNKISLSMKEIVAQIGSVFAPAIIAVGEVFGVVTKLIKFYIDFLKSYWTKLFEGFSFGVQRMAAFIGALQGGVGVLEAWRISGEVATRAVKEMSEEWKKGFQENRPIIDEAKLKLQEMQASMQSLEIQFKSGQITAEEYYRGVTEGQDLTILRNQEIMAQLNELATITRQVNDEQLLENERVTQEQINLLQFYKEEYMTAHAGMKAFTLEVAKTIQGSLSGALTDIIVGAKNAKEAFAAFGQAMIRAVVDFVIQKIVASAIEKALLATTVATSAVAGAAIAAAWAPAAAMVSLATLGGNAAPASAGIAATTALAQTLAIPIPRQFGGDDIVSRPTLFLVGENGPERAVFTPLGGRNDKGGSGSTFNINVYGANMNSGADIEALAEQLGFEVERKLRRARTLA